jgi:hypothetical protein
MTMVSVKEACRRLGSDAKTLCRWLADAQLPLQPDPHDARKKGMSGEHLHLLAHRPQRNLTPLSAGPSVPDARSPAPLPAALLALPEQLSALQAQIAALQQQVAALTHLLQQRPPELALPAVQPGKIRTRPAKPAPPGKQARPVAKAPSKPVHVLPRVEYGADGRDVVICPKKGRLPFEPDAPEWFDWLVSQSSFRFVGRCGRFTAHHEWRVPRGAWRAPRQIRNHSYTLRLAPAQELTLAVLEQAAQALQAHLT